MGKGVPLLAKKSGKRIADCVCHRTCRRQRDNHTTTSDSSLLLVYRVTGRGKANPDSRTTSSPTRASSMRVRATERCFPLATTRALVTPPSTKISSIFAVVRFIVSSPCWWRCVVTPNGNGCPNVYAFVPHRLFNMYASTHEHKENGNSSYPSVSFPIFGKTSLRFCQKCESPYSPTSAPQHSSLQRSGCPPPADGRGRSCCARQVRKGRCPAPPSPLRCRRS